MYAFLNELFVYMFYTFFGVIDLFHYKLEMEIKLKKPVIMVFNIYD